MKTRFLALLLALIMGASASASSETLTFAGECKLSLNGGTFTTIDSFHLEAKDGDCPSKEMEFSVPATDGATEYGIYIEFQRSEFAPGLKDKPYITYYKKSDRSVGGNRVNAFNVKPGTVLIFSQELKGDAHLLCSGNIK